MNKKESKPYKNTLLNEKKNIITELIRDNDDYSKLKEESIGDLVDAAYKNYQKDLLYGMSLNEKLTLEKIDSALGRIEDNSFGKCISCSSEIEKKRLDIIPYALKCYDCKNKEERSSGRMLPRPLLKPDLKPATKKKKAVPKKTAKKKAAVTKKKTAVTKKKTAVTKKKAAVTKKKNVPKKITKKKTAATNKKTASRSSRK